MSAAVVSVRIETVHAHPVGWGFESLRAHFSSRIANHNDVVQRFVQQCETDTARRDALRGRHALASGPMLTTSDER